VNILDPITEALTEFAPTRLLDDPRSVDSSIYLVIMGFFALVFLVGLVFALMPDRLSRGNRLHRQLFARYGAWAAWLGGAGPFVIGLRYVNVPLFSKRLWTLVNLIAVLAVLVHFLWYRITRYPDDLADYEEEQRRRRHINPPRRRRR
jgi:amino acid permease